MACLCDPPYHLTSITERFGGKNSAPIKDDRADDPYACIARGFMGKQWDGGNIAFQPDTWAALAHHLYPGAFVFAFAGTRGYHRMACAMEDAGLIIHPAICWLQAQGFPKATRIDTQIDTAAGAARDVVGPRVYAGGHIQHSSADKLEPPIGTFKKKQDERLNTAPATPLARAWAGHRYGLQALKPAFEFIAVAQVPYRGKPLDCITATGAGALNLDAGRVNPGDRVPGGGASWGASAGTHEGWKRPAHQNYESSDSHTMGRWPSNLILSHDPACAPDACTASCPARVLGEQSGESVSSVRTGQRTGKVKGTYGAFTGQDDVLMGHDDTGTAARYYYNADWMLDRLESTAPFYYQAKAHTGERECGLESSGAPRANTHPTVKPLSLTKYLASLLLPPDMYAPRRLLIPFAGVASECIGGLLAGWEEILGIEREHEYVAIGRERLDWWHAAMQQTGLADPETIRTRVGTLDKAMLTAQGRLPL